MRLINWLKGVRVPTFQLSDDDIVIFVVGPSGSGKSSFVREVTKSSFVREVTQSNLVKPSTSLQPRTAKVQAVRCELTEEARRTLKNPRQKNIVFVDTPSFHTGLNDEAAEKDMGSWLNKSKPKSTFVGTIYMHRIETDPCHEPIQRHLNTFASTFPQDFVPFPQRLHAVLSYEGIISENTIHTRKISFQAQLEELRPSLRGRVRWNVSCHPNLFRVDDPETAWEAVVALLLSHRHV